LWLFDPFELHLKEVALELFVDVVMFELTVHLDVAVETPIPIFANSLVQGCISHWRPFKEFHEPVGCGHDHIVIVTIVIGCRIDLQDVGDVIRPMLFRESCHATVWELLDPVGGLPHPILDRNGETWAAPIAVEHIPIGAFFSRQSGSIVDEVGSEKLQFFPLGVALPTLLLAVFLMFTFTLLEGLNESTGDVGDGVKIFSELDGGGGCAWWVDRSYVLHRFNGSRGGWWTGAGPGGGCRTANMIPFNRFDLDNRPGVSLDTRGGHEGWCLSSIGVVKGTRVVMAEVGVLKGVGLVDFMGLW
jgi:hypothetical protein